MTMITHADGTECPNPLEVTVFGYEGSYVCGCIPDDDEAEHEIVTPPEW